jgi:serine/threonine protein kinase
MRREIEVQSRLCDDHIMPVLDWGEDEFFWYVMPRGARTLADVPTPIDDSTLRSIIDAVLKALERAHEHDHPHRDVKPSNVVELKTDTGESRWVLADWGMTRRARGHTTADLTSTGRLLGTEGYAPPEAYTDAHEIGPRGDLYSLGKLIVWAKTGKAPVPNLVTDAPEPWRRLVRNLTRLKENERAESAAAAMSMLAAAESSSDAALLQRAREGESYAALEVCIHALSRTDDHDYLLDEIATLDNVADELVRNHPAEALELVKAMDAAFASFGRRNFDYANTPLRWMHAVARAAVADENFHLLEEVCDVLFPLEVSWNRFAQRDITAAWLLRITSPAADTVAECIRTHRRGMQSYLAGRLSHASSAVIRDAMRER